MSPIDGDVLFYIWSKMVWITSITVRTGGILQTKEVGIQFGLSLTKQADLITVRYPNEKM